MLSEPVKAKPPLGRIVVGSTVGAWHLGRSWPLPSQPFAGVTVVGSTVGGAVVVVGVTVVGDTVGEGDVVGEGDPVAEGVPVGEGDVVGDGEVVGEGDGDGEGEGEGEGEGDVPHAGVCEWFSTTVFVPPCPSWKEMTNCTCPGSFGPGPTSKTRCAVSPGTTVTVCDCPVNVSSVTTATMTLPGTSGSLFVTSAFTRT
jgi:hypothetical protein